MAGKTKGKSKSGELKVRNIERNRVRRIKAEIHRCEKKLKKLLAMFSEGKKRWKLKGKNKELIDKPQGIAPGSKRHERLEAHIKNLRALV